MIPRFKPWLGGPEFCALFRCNKGAVERFEQEFAKAFEAVDAVAFPYGRSAQWAFFKAVGTENAEVIMPAYTCAVVAHAVTLSGNRPRFIDIKLDDYNMDLDLIPSVINEDTRAIIATHTFGYPQDIDRLEAIVREGEARYGQKIWLIQDCAHSFGACWKGRLVGTSGDVGLYALNISKMMTAIFGGMLTFQNQQLADRVRAWRDQHFHKPGLLKPWLRRLYLLSVCTAFNERIYGLTWWLQQKTDLLDKLTKSYHLDDKIHFPPDYMDKMSDVEAAVGLEQLKRYPEIIARRRANAEWYDKYLRRREGWVFPPMHAGATYSHYVLRVPDRAAIIDAIARRGIELGELIQYSVPELVTYQEPDIACPLSGQASTATVNLPVGPCLSEYDRYRIAHPFSSLDNETLNRYRR